MGIANKIFILAVFTISCVQAQNPVLDNYIRQGLQVNLDLQQQKLGHLKSVSTVREARGNFMPGLTINARYSVAQGGRTIDFPLRDILSDYSAANNLANPELHLITPDQFRNEQIGFLRPTEHETKLSLIQPLFDTRIFYNLQIRKEISAADEKSLESATRRCIYAIREAYYKYMKAQELCQILDEFKKLATENLRVNEQLFANGKVTSDVVYRARAEELKADQQIVEAERAMQMARAYFNSLIRQPFDTPVQSDDRLIITHPVSSPDEAVSLASANREEITQLELLGEAAQMNVRMYSAGRLPSVFFAADYGYQGEKYRFSSRYDYLLASVIFRWDLFRGFQQQEKLRQAIFDRETAESRKLDIEQKIALEAIDGWYAYQAAIKAQEVSATEEEAMKRAFDMVKRKYDNGQASLLEYTEAQTRYRESAVNRIVKKYDVYNAWFELLRITASEDINSYKTFQP